MDKNANVNIFIVQSPLASLRTLCPQQKCVTKQENEGWEKKWDTFKIHPRSKSTRVQNPPSQIRDPLTDRG